MPASMLGITGEEEGHNADNESLASYFSNIGYEADQIPTRDTGKFIDMLSILSIYLIFLIMGFSVFIFHNFLK